MVSRSREASPVSTTQDVPLTRSTHKSRISEDRNLTDTLSTRVTRSSSRSVSPATATESEPGKASVKRTPSRRGRSKRSSQASSELGNDEVAPSTPTRRSTRSTSREPEASEIVDTTSRRTRSARKSDVLPRTPDAELGDQTPLTPSRRTRASVAKAAKAEGVNVMDSWENVTTPRRSTRSRSFRETSDTPSRRGRSAKDDLSDTSKSEIVESMTPSKTRSSRKITKVAEESEQKTVGTPVRRGRSFRGKTVSESNDVNETPQPITPRRGRSAKGETTFNDTFDVVTPTRSGRKAKLTLTDTPEKIKGRSHKEKSKEVPIVEEGSVTPTSTERDISIAATPVKASETFKKSMLNDPMLNQTTTEDQPTKNTPRRTPSRWVKAVAGDTEPQETVPGKPVRRTPSRRVKAAVADDDPAADITPQDVITETGRSRGVRRTPSRRAKSGIVDTELERSADVETVDEPAKSPGRRGRSKPQLIVTPIDDRAGGDAEMVTIKEVDGKINLYTVVISIQKSLSNFNKLKICLSQLDVLQMNLSLHF